jgi:hypothetical protein
MGLILAFTDQSTYKLCNGELDVPAGAITFSSPKALARAVSAKTLNEIRAKLFGEEVEYCPNREDAALRLWNLMTVSPGISYNKSLQEHPAKVTEFGTPKMLTTRKIELLHLMLPTSDYMTNYFYSKLEGQARQIVEMLLDDGRKVWTNAEANRVIWARADEIKGVQGASWVFSYYKSRLHHKRILRRITYEDFLTDPQFAGISLESKTY